MSSYIVKQSGKRLDTIVYEVFDSLDYFELILQNNPHLQGVLHLNIGDIVSLSPKQSKVLMPKVEESISSDSILLVTQEDQENNILFQDTTTQAQVKSEENLKSLW